MIPVDCEATVFIKGHKERTSVAADVQIMKGVCANQFT